MPQLLRRRDALFGAIVGPWNLERGDRRPRRTRSASSASTRVRSPLGVALREADRLAALYALAPPGQPAGAPSRPGPTLAKPVQDCYRRPRAALSALGAERRTWHRVSL